MTKRETLRNVEKQLLQKIEDDKHVRSRATIKEISAADTFGYAVNLGVQILRQCNCPLELAYIIINMVWRSLNVSSSTKAHDYLQLRNRILLQLKETLSVAMEKIPNLSETLVPLVSVSAIKHRGSRMEDNFLYVPNLRHLIEKDASIQEEAIGLFCVLDGHNGSDASEHCAALLIDSAFNQICRNNRHPMDYLSDAFERMELSLIDNRAHYRWTGGTTCTVCILHDRVIYSAWVGDSLAWLYYKDGRALLLTDRLHRPNVAEERKLVEEQGGWISDGGTPRVGGLLGITRSLGDSHLKAFSMPSMTSVELTGEELCLVIASDGLWDSKGCHGDNPELFSHLLDADRFHMSEKITQCAIKGGSSDNITVGVVWLDEYEKGTKRKTVPRALPEGLRCSSPPRQLRRDDD